MKKPLYTDFPIKCPLKAQQTDSHCGAAVVQGLLAKYHIRATQDLIVATARAKTRVEKHGIRPEQLARALRLLAPKHQFWFKQNATSSDISYLIHTSHLPVVINWQGLFYDTVEEEARFNPDGEHGHYSIAIDIDEAKDKIVIADPYSEYVENPRIFSYDWFQTRWWDVDHMVDKKTGRANSISTNHLLFVLVPKKTVFPSELGLQLPDQLTCLYRNLEDGEARKPFGKPLTLIKQLLSHVMLKQ